jgi:hypothetical protein
MKGLVDNYLVELDCLYDKGMLVGKYLGSDQMFEKQLIGSDNEALFNPNRFRRTYGDIKAAPSSFSDMVTEDRDGKFYTMKDLYSKPLKTGEKAHFFWTAASKDEIIQEDRTFGEGGMSVKYLFRIPAHRIVCSSSGKNIKMNGDYMLVKPVLQDESEIRTASGLWLAEKPAPKYLEGIVHHTNCGLIYKKVIFYPNADAELDVNGETFYAMRRNYVMATKEDFTTPTDTHVLIEPDPQVTLFPNGIEIPERFRKFKPTGRVVRLGPDCRELSIGDRVQHEGYGVEVDGLRMIREGSVQLILS